MFLQFPQFTHIDMTISEHFNAWLAHDFRKGTQRSVKIGD